MLSTRTFESSSLDRSRMWRRRVLMLALLVMTATIQAQVTQQASALPQRSANDRMLEPGPEARWLAGRVGTWDVVMRLQPAPDATPVVVRGLIAERTMIGLYLQEKMEPNPGSDVAKFSRIEYLTFNSVEQRWQYVSLDTRAPVGLMPAKLRDSRPRHHRRVLRELGARRLWTRVRGKTVPRAACDDARVRRPGRLTPVLDESGRPRVVGRGVRIHEKAVRPMPDEHG
jgi:hypothetical protein